MTDSLHPSSTDQRYATRPLLGRLWRDYLKKYRFWMILAVILMMIEGATLATVARLLEPMFDQVFVGGELSAVWWIGGAIMAVFAIRGVADFGKNTVLAFVTQRSSTDMQVGLLRHLLRLDSQFFHDNSPGALMERIQGDTQQVQLVWHVAIQTFGRDFFSLFWLFMVAIYIDPVWTLVAVITVPLLILPIAVLQRYIRRKARLMRETAAHRSTRLDEVFHGIKQVKLNQMETYQANRFQQIIDIIVRAEIRAAAGRAMIPSLIDIVTGIGFFTVLLIGGRDIVSGDKTVGEFMSFFTAMSLTFQPLRRLGGVAGYWQVARTSLERLYVLFDQEPTITDGSTHIQTATGNTRVEFRDVHLDFDALPALAGLSFTAEPGQTTAIVGPSGAGKSTVLGVLTRLLDPAAGAVLLGGMDVRDFPLAVLRAQFASVAQDAQLFDESLRENITLGQADVDDGRISEVLEAARVAEFIDRLPQGIDSPAGPRGANLSGGQRQRIAIARALLRDAPILLLDEATSALDAQSEVAVQEALDRLTEGRTTLVIAHRLSTIRNADKIIVMNEGRVVEEGTHDTLLAKGGLYADLHALQASAAS